MFQEAWNQAVELARFWVECFGKFCTQYSGVISLSSLIIAAGILIRIIMAIGTRSPIDREYTAQGILKMECLFVCIFFLRFCEACVKGVALHSFIVILISSIIVLGITFFSWIRDQSWIGDQISAGHLSFSSGFYLFSGFYMLLLFVMLMANYRAVYKESDHECLRFTSTTIESSSDEEVGASN